MKNVHWYHTHPLVLINTLHLILLKFQVNFHLTANCSLNLR
jgi:hypothetical protein